VSGDRKLDSLCVLAPVREGHEEPLHATLAALPAGDASPLRQLRTHVARFVIVPPLRDCDGRALDSTSYLLFGSEFDGTCDEYVDALARIPPAPRIWSHCVGYREDEDPSALARYLHDYRLKPGTSVVAYESATVADVLECVALRKRVAGFVLRTRGLDAAERRRAWLSEFAPRS
jgi:hypothetical protein